VIENPILRGFNPDPSIIRVGKDYYIATSTFEWFPGVQIHHSTDLSNWQLITHPLNTIELLNMKGVPDSCGVWAPCLSYHKDTFYLVYSNVKSFDGLWKDTPNYLTTAKNIQGPWSKPIFLSASGFDGSLFHDDDDRKYYLSMLVDHRKGKFFGGIILKEYNVEEKRLVGQTHLIFEGTDLGLTEAPHLYKKDNYYYLITAEGGTEYGHAATLARSKNILGPYEVHPNNPLISTRNNPNHPLQKAGHADIVFDENNHAWIVFLCGRPLTKLGNCVLGRETSIERLIWEESKWPHLAAGGAEPRIEIPTKEHYTQKTNTLKTIERIDFAKEKLNIHYQTLRIPKDESWLKYKEGNLYLKGRDSLSSTFNQSLVARRIQSFHISYQVGLEFKPESFQQMAGLVCYYNTGHHYYLCMMGDELSGKVYLNLIRNDNFQTEELLDNYIEITQEKIHLKVIWHESTLQFFYSLNEVDWIKVGEDYGAEILSDDYVREGSDRYRPAFTGSFVGVTCNDLTGEGIWAKFTYLEYQEL